MRVMAKAYGWTPCQMYEFSADELDYWFDAAKKSLEGKY
jgi:hypothetical protein